MESTLGTGFQIAFFYPQTVFLKINQATDVFASFLIPSCVAIASAALLLLHVSASHLKSWSETDSDALAQPRRHISALGGPVIFGYYVVRLAACLALVGLAAVPIVKDEGEKKIHVAVLCIFVYAAALAFASVLANWRWSRNSIRHLNIVLCVTLLVYVYRDVYPLGTFVLRPQDENEGHLLWAKVSLLTLAAVVIPLTVPRKYIPVDPKHPREPTPEQTCSLLSRLVFGFMDTVVMKAYRSPSLPYEDLPPLSDYDYAEYLKKRSFRYLDPTIIVKRRNVFFSLVRVFAMDFTVLSIIVVLQSVLDFATPVGVNMLLGYIETGGVNAFYKPWVWILWLFFGPLLQTMAAETYLYISTRQVVHAEAILTETVLEHALRIRVKAETSDKEAADPLPPTPPSGTTTPSLRDAEASESSSAADEDDQKTLRSAAPSDAQSRDTTVQAGSSANASRQASSTDLKKPDTKPPPSPTPETPAAKPKVESKNILGKINNLVTTDMQNITDGKEALRLIIFVPVQVTLSILFLHKVLGWSAYVGLAMIIILFPIPGFFTKLMQRFQKLRMKKTDARIQMVTETMNVLRMVKFFGWEGMMNKRIKDAREDELTYLRKLRFVDLASSLSNHMIPLLTMLVTYATYTLVMKEQLSASKVFSSMVVFDKFSMLLYRVMYYITQSVNAKVSLDRVTEFLYETELLDEFQPKSNDVVLPVITPTQEIGFRNATFAWSNDDNEGSMTPSKRQFLLKIDGELIFRKGTINLIVGKTGSGKTSVLMALLSEMHFIQSGPDSWYNLPRQHGVAYAAQESWVQNATIKENIVFGAEFEEERYKKVLFQCALERDLELFQAGDETEVGEKGLTLSGGQKARVTLARALYSKAETILLDDVLAALDVHTSKWIIERCFKGDLVQDRTILMVTHNVALAQSVAGFVVSIKDGRVVSQGTVSDALSKDSTLAHQVEIDETIEEAVEEISPDGDKKKPSDGEGKLIVAEEVQIGNVGWPALRLLLKGLGGQHPILFFATFFTGMVLSDIGEIFQTYFLGYFASQYETHEPSEVNVVFYLTGYSLILLFVVVTFAIGWIVWMFGALRASRTIHRQLVESVLGTTLRWLDTTPTSRVITRATQDMRDVDVQLPNQLAALTRLTIIMMAQFISVMYFSPLFILPGILVTLAGALCGSIYIKAQLPIKRVQSNAKAPVLAHFGTVLAGLVSVRAYGVQQRFIKESLTRINYYSRPSRVFWNLNRWIDVRLDLFGNVFSAGLAFYLVYISHGQAATIGFSLNMAVMFSSSILYYIRIMNMFQVRANSLERINAYIEIEQEPKPTEGGKPPAYWPASGDLRVENLSARYSLNGPPVLQDVNFHVQAGERIGVVGRTGSGKSSLMLSLLRCIYTEGEVYLDGIPTSSINLDDLRTKITIIPQMPELLSGTVRRNLDPFDQYDDATLYDALRSAGLYSIQSESDEDARVGLDTAVASGGGNLSVGQRQILALARAMVRESKLLILDEATSAIDYKTDAVIQSSLRTELKGDVTLITVAHRLQTILDADKIMVLDAGRIVEYDSPKELLKNPVGHLRALVDESADKEHLYRMAEGIAGPLLSSI
ncbi:P-loop containing nucleoside triphosphate hydrolase protein [Rhodocollybia butyracea]|uniref:P-loop containing nucleoside triphosphate hydrolase protein n=1 Tax=Rhodocollybia butyracea TaxID=206335 RepID=A0A9P5P4D7_9AGAR|nr:P-loop containing nucleoside triphosphate hydrolase protein [Rhodocollybia butyracea]